MSKIRILPENICNKIAAGEVIARPASVVKELIENSIDAGAGKIVVRTERAGSKLISVRDDGCGMNEDDALLCLEPHATSKISEIEDMNHILSFGFRGEALPSIASVSRFYLRTRARESLEGTEVIVEGGTFAHTAPIGCPCGTEISVKELFFNTPARKKFLKSAATEEKHIHETIIALALPYPSLSFELYSDGRQIISTPAHDDLLPRLRSFFGVTTQKSIIPVQYSESGISVKGYIAKHGFFRNQRREQRVYVNGRPVDALAAFRGVRDGYGSLVPKGKYPPVILFLEMDPVLVDVNVHPAKKEVRFNQERIVSSVISNTIRMALRRSNTPSSNLDLSDFSLQSLLQGAEVSYDFKTDHPAFDFSPSPEPVGNIQQTNHAENAPVTSVPSSADDQMSESIEQIVGLVTPTPDLSSAEKFPAQRHDDISQRGESIQSIDNRTSKVLGKPEEKKLPDSEDVFPNHNAMEILGSLDDTYLIAQTESGLIIIDQHAAHERILFEKILKNARSDQPSQKLLIPITIELGRSEVLFLEKHHHHFTELGFELEPFGQNTVLVHEVPSVFPQENIGNLISEIIEELTEEEEFTKRFDMNAIAIAACKRAVKANDKLSVIEAKNLVRQMSECDLPYCCPHGRPTIIQVSIRELEKRFGRR